MTANPKGKDEFPFVCRTVPIILSNNAPATRDISGALADRALVFPFNHRVPASEKDIDLGRKLEKEYPGIFARCVKAYARMVKRGTWKFPVDCTVAWKKWQAQSNPLNLFIEQVLIEDEEGVTKCAEVWGAYGTWHAEEVAYGARGGTALTRNKFYESFEDATGLTKNRHAELGNVYKGVTLDKSYQDFSDE